MGCLGSYSYIRGKGEGVDQGGREWDAWDPTLISEVKGRGVGQGGGTSKRYRVGEDWFVKELSFCHKL